MVLIFIKCYFILAPLVTIVSNPAGTPVSGFSNTFDYPILSNVTLTCMVDLSLPANTTYQWNTTGCYTNNIHNTPKCFPTGQTTQSVTGYHLVAKDAGTITCTVTIGGDDYTSEPLILRISGMHIHNINVHDSNIYQNSLVQYCSNVTSHLCTLAKLQVTKNAN